MVVSMVYETRKETKEKTKGNLPDRSKTTNRSIFDDDVTTGRWRRYLKTGDGGQQGRGNKKGKEKRKQ
jgi:hypothetical protein